MSNDDEALEELMQHLREEVRVESMRIGNRLVFFVDEEAPILVGFERAREFRISGTTYKVEWNEEGKGRDDGESAAMFAHYQSKNKDELRKLAKSYGLVLDRKTSKDNMVKLLAEISRKWNQEAASSEDDD